MIAYVDSSLLASAYLPDEARHSDMVRLIRDDRIALITGTWTRIEVSGALARAARHAGTDPAHLHAALDDDLDPLVGPIREVRTPQDEIERLALRIVRVHALRAMDAWHVASAALTLPELAESQEAYGFATSDERQAGVARAIGLDVLPLHPASP